MIQINEAVSFDTYNFTFYSANKTLFLSRLIPVENKLVVPGHHIKSLRLFVTNACNLRCPYCYEWKKPAKSMSIDCAQKLIEVFGKEVRSIQFFGGEPLLEKDKIKTIYKMYNDYNNNMKYHIMTNGTLIDSDLIEWINSKDNVKIGISWDGIGDFSRYGNNGEIAAKVMSNIDKLIKYCKDKISIRITVYKTDLKSLNDTVNVLLDNHIPVSVEPAFDYVKMDISDHVYNVMIEFYKKIGDKIVGINGYKSIKDQLISGAYRYYNCGAGRHSLRVDTNGDIYDCHRMMPNKNNFLANIRDIEHVSQLDNKRFYASKCNLRAECCNCEYRFLCGGGCLYSHSQKFCEIIKVKIRSILQQIWSEYSDL